MENNSRPLAIHIRGLKKQYRLGTIGGGTLVADLQSWWAKMRNKEDPNVKIGEENRFSGSRNDKFYAVDGIDLDVYKGEALGIIGMNGAGKSTLLKLITRITAPTEGEICYNGRIASMLEVGTGFHNEMTGRENIYLNGAILGMSKEEVKQKIDDIIEFSECADFIDTPIKRYSSGMRVKLGFSVAAHLSNEILIMDEVLAVGDMNFQNKCIKKMNEISAEEGRTILYVSHNMATIRQLCTRCIVLDKGKKTFDGDVETAIEIYSQGVAKSMTLENDLQMIKRPIGATSFDGSIRMKTATFLRKQSPIYKMGEPLVLKIKWDAIHDINDAVFRVIVKYQGTIPVGTAYAEKPIKTSAHEVREDTFLMDFGLLAEGSYTVDLFFSVMSGKKAVSNYDAVLNGLTFEIQSEGASGWKHNSTGSVIFSPIRCVQ